MQPGGRSRRSRWTSFIADAEAPGRAVRGLHEEGNPRHRLRVEHDQRTLLIHLSDEDGEGWTTIAIDRETRRFAVAQGRQQAVTAQRASASLHGEARAQPGSPAPAARRSEPGSSPAPGERPERRASRGDR